ncbi:MAG: hypothetical protein SFU56_22755 [Capsulimonadales bacterium]|nr:hypothetical protein [Capsulimonadales bacterium]
MFSRLARYVALPAIGLVSLLSAPSVKAQVLAPEVLVGGKTQRELALDWFRWLATTPVGPNPFSATGSLHPMMEVTGAQSFRGAQSGTPGVFFIGGTFSDINGFSTVQRTVHIAENTSLFFPLVTNGPADNTNIPPAPPTTLTPDEMLNGGFGTDYLTSFDGSQLFTEVNGIAATGLNAHRQTFGGAGFDVVYTNTDNLNAAFGFDVTLGTGIFPSSVLSAADGYFVALAPLSKGFHTIHFGSTTDFVAPDGTFQRTFTQDITYLVTVGAPEPVSIALFLAPSLVVGLLLMTKTRKESV